MYYKTISCNLRNMSSINPGLGKSVFNQILASFHQPHTQQYLTETAEIHDDPGKGPETKHDIEVEYWFVRSADLFVVKRSPDKMGEHPENSVNDLTLIIRPDDEDTTNKTLENITNMCSS